MKKLNKALAVILCCSLVLSLCFPQKSEAASAAVIPWLIAVVAAAAGYVAYGSTINNSYDYDQIYNSVVNYAKSNSNVAGSSAWLNFSYSPSANLTVDALQSMTQLFGSWAAANYSNGTFANTSVGVSGLSGTSDGFFSIAQSFGLSSDVYNKWYMEITSDVNVSGYAVYDFDYNSGGSTVHYKVLGAIAYLPVVNYFVENESDKLSQLYGIYEYSQDGKINRDINSVTLFHCIAAVYTSDGKFLSSTATSGFPNASNSSYFVCCPVYTYRNNYGQYTLNGTLRTIKLYDDIYTNNGKSFIPVDNLTPLTNYNSLSPTLQDLTVNKYYNVTGDTAITIPTDDVVDKVVASIGSVVTKDELQDIVDKAIADAIGVTIDFPIDIPIDRPIDRPITDEKDDTVVVPGDVTISDNLEDYSPTSAITTLFPFCLPFDLINLVKAFNAAPEAPVFDLPIKLKFPADGSIINVSEKFTIDFAVFESYIKAIRLFEVAAFIGGLIMITRAHMIKS